MQDHYPLTLSDLIISLSSLSTESLAMGARVAGGGSIPPALCKLIAESHQVTQCLPSRDCPLHGWQSQPETAVHDWQSQPETRGWSEGVLVVCGGSIPPAPNESIATAVASSVILEEC